MNFLNKILIFGFIFLLIINICFAGDEISQGLKNPLNTDNILEVLNRLLNFLVLNIAPVLLSIFIIIGGYQILFAMGNPEKIKKGKNIITYAIVGYLIILLSTGIVSIVFDILGVGKNK